MVAMPICSCVLVLSALSRRSWRNRVSGSTSPLEVEKPWEIPTGNRGFTRKIAWTSVKIVNWKSHWKQWFQQENHWNIPENGCFTPWKTGCWLNLNLSEKDVNSSIGRMIIPNLWNNKKLFQTTNQLGVELLLYRLSLYELPRIKIVFFSRANLVVYQEVSFFNFYLDTIIEIKIGT